MFLVAGALCMVMSCSLAQADTVLLDDHFAGDADDPLDAGKWTGISNYVQNGESFASHGTRNSGWFYSSSSFGGSSSQPTIVAEFLGVSIGNAPTTVDNFFGISIPTGANKARGVTFRLRSDYGSDVTACVSNDVNSAWHHQDRITTFAMANDTLYDFRIEWTTEGTKQVDFYGKLASAGTYTALSSCTTQSAIPTGDYQVCVYSQTVHMDIDRITITEVPEPATMTLLLLGLPFALRRRR